ncbi:MAG: hypothetical protein ACRD1Y_06745 [Terriglobales bacterium]
MSPERTTGAKLGRAAAMLWRQRQRLQQAPLQSAAARLGRAAGTLGGEKAQAHARTPGALGAAFRSGRRALWAHAGNALGRLGLQVSAVLYLIFAVGFGWAGVNGWMADRTHLHIPVSTSLTQASGATQFELALAVIFAYFGISSLLRAAARRS